MLKNFYIKTVYLKFGWFIRSIYLKPKTLGMTNSNSVRTLLPIIQVIGCLSVFVTFPVFVPQILTNHLNDMVLLYIKASYRSKEGL